MKNIFSINLSLAVLSITNVCSAAATGPEIGNFLSKNGWTAYDQNKPVAKLSDDLVPLMYYPKNIDVPACGLLNAEAGNLSFLEILAPEAGAEYPHCGGINDGASFNMSGKKYFVYEYSDRDSRDETYGRFFYVYRTKNSYVIDEKLNAAFDGVLQTKGKAPLKAMEGIKLARGYQLQLSQPKLTMLSRDLVADSGGGFAVFKAKSNAICTFVVDNGVQLTSYTSATFNKDGSCVNYIASSKLETPAKIFYLGMYNGSNETRQLAIFSVEKNTAVVSVENELATSAIKTGKIVDIKSFKAYITDSVRR